MPGSTGTVPPRVLRITEHLAAVTRHLIAHERSCIVVIEPDSGARRVATVHQRANSTPADPLVELVIHPGARVLSGTAESLASLGVRPERPPASWMAAPLAIADRTLGAVVLESDRPGAFTERAQTLLEMLATQGAVAIDQAWLLELLSQGKREWEQTIDAIPEAFCVVGPATEIRRANIAFGAFVQQPVTALRDRPVLDVMPPPCVTAVRSALDQPEEAVPIELAVGDRRYLFSVMPLGELDERMCVLVFADQTEKRRLQEQLIQSEKMSAVGQLIAGIAHDLNNPLASVVGFADYLVESVEDLPPRLHEPLRAIQQEAERAAKIVRNLLSFARKQERQRRAQPVAPLLEGTLLLLNNEFLACHVTPHLEIEAGLPDVDVDANQLQQVIVNLLTNAVQAIAASGVGSDVTLRATAWLDGVAVAIEDDGPGIPAELRERVFEPFFTTKPEGQGTGLGLAICNGIVAEHGGRLTLVDQASHGTVFRIELPGTAGRPEAQPAPLRAVGRLRVLVVDDEPHILHYMHATLSSWGHEVAVSVDGGEALDLLQREEFDVIISDLRMPRMSGQEFYEALARERPRAAHRMIFSTGDTVRGDALAFLEGLGRPYLRKPFSLAELRAVLVASEAREER